MLSRRRSGARRQQIKDQRLAGLRVEAEHIVIVVLDHAVDHHRQRDLLRVRQIVVRLEFTLSGSDPTWKTPTWVPRGVRRR